MSRFKLLYFLILITNWSETNAQISDKRLCADEKCEVPVSRAKTLLRYSSPQSGILSFAPNVDVIIYSKSAGSREDLWGAEINGKRGYIPKDKVRETKILQKPTILVDTEFAKAVEAKQVPSKVEPQQMKEPYEVIDGTTIYLSPQEDITPSSTYSPIESTALPPGADHILQNESLNENEKTIDVSEAQDDVIKETPVKNEEKENIQEDVTVEDKGEISSTAEIDTEDDDLDSKEDDDEDTIASEIKSDAQDTIQQSQVQTVTEKARLASLSDQYAEGSNCESSQSQSSSSNVLSNSDEATVVEVTSTSPELEVPQPFDDTFVEVTPDPLEKISKASPTVPYLESFKESTAKSVEFSENKAVSEEKNEMIKDTMLDENPFDADATGFLPNNPGDIQSELRVAKTEDNIIDSTSQQTVNEDDEEPHQQQQQPEEESSQPQTVSSSNDFNEATTVPIGVTSVNPELEVSQPLDDMFVEVTPPDPLDKISKDSEKQTSPTVPHLDSSKESAAKSVEFSENKAVSDEKNEMILDENPSDTDTTGFLPDSPEDIQSELRVAKTGEPHQQKPEEESSQPQTVSLSSDFNEATTAPIEVTSVIPELEIPQPLDDMFVEVTPDPLEKVSEESVIVKETRPTVPYLSLSKESSAESVGSSENKEVTEEISDVQIGDINKETVTEGSAFDPHLQSRGDIQSDLKVAEPEDNIVVVDTTTTDYSSQPTTDAAYEDNQQQERRQLDAADEVVKATDEKQISNKENTGSWLFDRIKSVFDGNAEESEKAAADENEETSMINRVQNEDILPMSEKGTYCDATPCGTSETALEKDGAMGFFSFNPDVFLYLVTTAVSIIVFLFGYIAFDKCKREGPLVAKINRLEKQLLVLIKENQILQEKLSTESGYETNDVVPNEVVENLKRELHDTTNVKNALEEQVQSLEKELENSTEVGMELNKMLSEILSSENGSDVIKSNVEHLQRQLVEQQTTINSINETLAITNTENHELRLELELNNKKVVDLQTELDKLLLNILKIEEEKDAQQSTLEREVANYRHKYEDVNNRLRSIEEEYNSDLKQFKNRLDQTERKLELKMREHDALTETLKQLKTVKNNDDSTLKKLLEVNGIKAELQLLRSENNRFVERLQHEEELKLNYEKRAQSTFDELQQLKDKYDEADKLRVEAQTKLEVLSNYFKDRETQWQKEINKHEALWAEKEGEATSTTERIKFMQEQLQNYKAQTDALKQEIMSQEIELKSQISVLEKKAHENWVSARQAERKLEEAKQEAAQLRHRLTLRERAIQEDKNQHRLQSPIEQNGDMPVSPLESPASPPLLYGARDHITKSPPIPGLPPFLPPPPGVPFMPPPIHGVPPFIPPPPHNMFPGDHRPPPLGRMSSPPLNSRYSPSSRGYSPYDRNSSSPSDSEYGTSPPHRRAYSPFNSRDERRDYKRPPPGRINGRNLAKDVASSESGNSNESLEKINRQPKV